jgi:hypothetical protein
MTVATTLVTADEYLFRMMNLKFYRQDTEMALDNFMFSGLSEWSKFAPELMLSHCRIITTIEKHARRAFQTLVAMFSELLTKAGADYSQILNEFIQTRFDPRTAETYLASLGDVLIPLMTEILSGDILAQDYRTLIKTISYMIRLTLRSCALEPTRERKLNIDALFGKLCQIVGEVEEDKIRNSFVTTNQRLLLQHFAPVIEDMTLVFSPDEAVGELIKFVASIRSGNESVDRAKLTLLNQIVHVRQLWTRGTTPPLCYVYTQEVTRALERSKGRAEPEVCHILTSLFATNASTLVSWIPLLSPMAGDPQITHLLLEIAFYFPRQFPRKVMLPLVANSLRPTHEAIFVVTHWLQARSDVLRRKAPAKLHEVLRHVIPLGASLGYVNREDLDYAIDERVYDISRGVVNLADLFQVLPINMRADFSLIRRVIEFSMCCESPALVRIYHAIIAGDQVIAKRETLRAMFALMQNVSFSAIRGFLKGESASIQRAAECIHTLQLLTEEPQNESERAEAICELLSIASDAHDRHINMTLIRMLLGLNQAFGNSAEAALSLVQMLEHVRCADDAEAGVPGFTSSNGREFHAEVLTKVSELLIEDSYEEYALPYLDRLVKTCVLPFRHVELMASVASIRSKLYTSIATGTRAFSRYFWVSFYGEGFDPAWQFRQWVYRRPARKGDSFVREMRIKFPNATVGPDKPPSGATTPYVRVIELEPSSPDEIENFLAKPEFAMPRYIAEFRRQDRPSVFRAETVASTNSAVSDLTQEYVVVMETFPTTVRRVAVNRSRCVTRKLTAAQHATLVVSRLNYRIASNLYWYRNDFGEGKQVVERLDEVVSEVALSLTLPQTLESGTLLAYLDDFLSPDWVAYNPECADAIPGFKAVVQEQADLIPQVVRLNPRTTLAPSQLSLLTAIAALTEKAFQTYLLIRTKLGPFGFKSVVGKGE